MCMAGKFINKKFTKFIEQYCIRIKKLILKN